jgi:hypothetical protein
MEIKGPNADDTDEGAEMDRELRERRDEAIWQRFAFQERIDAARADRDEAAERMRFVGLAQEIKAIRNKLGYPVRYASALLCAVVIGAGAAGLVYKAETMSNRGAAQITRQTNRAFPDHREPVPSVELDDGQRAGIAVSGVFGMFLGGLGGMWVGEGLSVRTARWRARRIVRRAEDGTAGQPEDHPEDQPEE